MKQFTPQEEAELRRALGELRDAIPLGIVTAVDIDSLLAFCRKRLGGQDAGHADTSSSPPPRSARNQDAGGDVVIPCGYCFSMGSRAGGCACEVCEGAGRVSVPRSWVQCKACLGLGFRTGAPCPVCKGFMRVPVQQARGGV